MKDDGSCGFKKYSTTSQQNLDLSLRFFKVRSQKRKNWQIYLRFVWKMPKNVKKLITFSLLIQSSSKFIQSKSIEVEKNV